MELRNGVDASGRKPTVSASIFISFFVCRKCSVGVSRKKKKEGGISKTLLIFLLALIGFFVNAG